MKLLRVVLLTILTGVGVALTYFYFEWAVHHAIDFIWDDLFGSEDRRWLVPVICVPLTLAYFGLQHLLDRGAERHESHGLGSAPKPSVANFAKILLIGFFSLVAGASLGPEAVLVPACVVLGSYIGTKLMTDDKRSAKLFGIAGFIALFAAFFNSFLVGLLSLLLIKKEFKLDLSAKIIAFAAIASGSTIATLSHLNSSAFVGLPAYSWELDIGMVLLLAALAVAGYAAVHFLGQVHAGSVSLVAPLREASWWVHALAAGAGLSALYLLGGQLVQFTGNESIVPMFKQAADLGYLGLVWILLVKLLAIGWSKASGYRGGLVFPSVFVAAVLVAIGQLYSADLNLIYGLIAAMTGIIAADRKVKILF